MSLLPESVRPKQIVIWRNRFADGSDYCALYPLSSGWLLKGTAIASLNPREPVLVHYEVQCGADWRTQAVELHCAHGAVHAHAALRVSPSGIWQRDGVELASATAASMWISPSRPLRTRCPFAGSASLPALRKA